MTLGNAWGGIPPDEDHKQLMICAFPNCHIEADNEPLIVTGYRGEMRTFCRQHLDQLATSYTPCSWCGRAANDSIHSVYTMRTVVGAHKFDPLPEGP